jgi:hypothetical protein
MYAQAHGKSPPATAISKASGAPKERVTGHPEGIPKGNRSSWGQLLDVGRLGLAQDFRKPV